MVNLKFKCPKDRLLIELLSVKGGSMHCTQVIHFAKLYLLILLAAGCPHFQYCW